MPEMEALMTTATSTAITFERVLVPTDFSDESQRALDYARSIARLYQSQLFLVHVNEPANLIEPPEAAWVAEERIEKELAEQLEQAGAALRSEGFQAQALSVTGMIQDEIVSVVKTNKIDMVVIGTHGRRGWSRFFFGSDAETVMRHVRCPVLMVGPAVAAITNQVWHPKHLICATTFDPGSAWIAAYAYRLARQYQAEFTLLNVETSIDTENPGAWLLFEKSFKESVGDDLILGTPLQTLLCEKAPGGIVYLAKKQNADLIIMGAHAASGITSHGSPGTVSQVVAEAPCPVMTLLQ